MDYKYIVLAVLIALSAFFSSAEVALLSVTPIRVRTYLKEQRPGAGALDRLKANPRRMIITILIGNNVANIAASTVVSVIATQHFGSSSLGLAAGILTLVILVFGEITPKTLSSRHAGSIALRIARPIEVLSKIFFPLVFFLEYFSVLLEKFFRFKAHAQITEADIKTMVEFGVEKNIVQLEEQAIINKALIFSDLTAQDVMIPIQDVFLINAEQLIQESFRSIVESGYSRIPVFRNSRENIIGLVLIKDVATAMIAGQVSQAISTIAIDPIMVPLNIRIDYLFKIFQTKRKHMAVVYGENRKAVGVVTLEDLLEELVGEIADESDE